MKRVVVAGVCLALLQPVGAQERQQAPKAASDDPASGEIIARFLASTGTPLSSYQAVRTLTADARGGKSHATMTVRTSLDPVDGFHYTVLTEEGSGTIRTRVFHAALEAERTMRAEGEAAKGALTPDNYDLTVEPTTDEGLVPIRMHPKRSDKLLIDGHLYVSASDGDLVRVEGVLVKRPSFWTRKVEVVRRYARILGVRVPTAMESTAHVLIVGTSTFSMTYAYEFINGQAVSALGGAPLDRQP